MPASLDRLQFAPPPPPGMLRALGFAVIAHILLMLALGWGVNWKRDSVTLAVEAELWSALPQEASPKAVEPAAVPAPVPVPVPVPPPAVVAEPPKPEPAPREPEIALERKKEKLAEARRKQLALEREEKREAEKELAARKKAAAEKKLEAKRELEERQKLESARRQQADEKRIESQRQANLDRMKGMAGATGSQEAKGTAIQSSGMSDSYPGRIRARVKPNIVFGEDIAGNPKAEVEVRTAPDGTIVGQRIVKSSGVRSWDEAVLKAVIKTEVLPRDVDGRVRSPLIIEFRPKD